LDVEEHEELEDEEELEEDWEEPVWELGPEEGKDWRFNWLSDSFSSNSPKVPK
jgi:hypothetical protein